MDLGGGEDLERTLEIYFLKECLRPQIKVILKAEIE